MYPPQVVWRTNKLLLYSFTRKAGCDVVSSKPLPAETRGRIMHMGGLSPIVALWMHSRGLGLVVVAVAAAIVM